MWVMQQPPKQHPATFCSRLFIWHGGAAFHESKTSVFQIAMTMVCRDLPQLANGSKTTRFLLRFDY
jgi:hypothetical protein